MCNMIYDDIDDSKYINIDTEKTLQCIEDRYNSSKSDLLYNKARINKIVDDYNIMLSIAFKRAEWQAEDLDKYKTIVNRVFKYNLQDKELISLLKWTGREIWFSRNYGTQVIPDGAGFRVTLIEKHRKTDNIIGYLLSKEKKQTLSIIMTYINEDKTNIDSGVLYDKEGRYRWNDTYNRIYGYKDIYKTVESYTGIWKENTWNLNKKSKENERHFKDIREGYLYMYELFNRYEVFHDKYIDMVNDWLKNNDYLKIKEKTEDK